MKHACESQHRRTSARAHERTSTRLIMTSFQPVFIMHSAFCCHHSKCRERGDGWGGLERQRALMG